MPCYKPMKGYASRELTKNGKRKFVTSPKKGFPDMPLTLPCGNCIGCRLDRSKDWAVRCVHEASLHEDNSFLTLTYKDTPPNGNLEVKDFQDFMKRLRKKFPNKKLRYFHCGEYGEKLKRPHYHVILFGLDFEDKEPWSVHNGQQYYTSKILSDTWGLGHCLIGNVTFQSAAYVARYITKKVTGKDAEEHYEYFDEFTGELRQRVPEYTTMSRRNGIGQGWFEKYWYDTYKDDYVVINGRKFKPPRYYDKLLAEKDSKLFERIKAKRIQNIDEFDEENSRYRLETKEQCKLAQLTRLIRDYEGGN